MNIHSSAIVSKRAVLSCPIHFSHHLDNVLYDLRGPIQDKADELQRQGVKVIPLNVGNPAPFGFRPSAEVLSAMHRGLEETSGYSNSLGLSDTRQTVVDYYSQNEDFPALDSNHVLVGNGVSELVNLCLQALINDGDEILIPSPDYPLWTASTTLAGGVPVHYSCLEENNWQPDVDAIRESITAKTRAIVIINPNNPTGTIYSPETLSQIAQLAREHNLVLLSDEIYDRIVYPGASFTPTACLAQDVPCLTFSGLSKTHRLAGLRAGWVTATGFREQDTLFKGIRLLASMRMCASIPAQHAIAAVLGKEHSIDNLVRPGGRLFEQKVAATTALSKIPGISFIEPQGALYIFIRLDGNIYEIDKDEDFVLSFLEAEHIHIVQGSAFNVKGGTYVRITFLPEVETIEHFAARFAAHLEKYAKR